MIALAGEIQVYIDAGTRGVVVTQGTDTIEGTAFVLDLLVHPDAPIVVTGAMRHPSLPGAEGPANLLASVQVAVSDVARGVGTVVGRPERRDPRCPLRAEDSHPEPRDLSLPAHRAGGLGL